MDQRKTDNATDNFSEYSAVKLSPSTIQRMARPPRRTPACVAPLRPREMHVSSRIRPRALADIVPSALYPRYQRRARLQVTRTRCAHRLFAKISAEASAMEFCKDQLEMLRNRAFWIVNCG